MTLRDNILAILNNKTPERVPVLAFGYWEDTVDRWAREGHITVEEAQGYKRGGDNSPADRRIMDRLGFDWCWGAAVYSDTGLRPPFPEETLEIRPDGGRVIRNAEGLLCMVKPGVVSIPAEIGTSLTGRQAWEELYLPRLQYDAARVPWERLAALPRPEERQVPLGIHIGSYMGTMRNYLGVEGLSYLWADDEELYREIVDTMCGLCYTCAQAALSTGVQFDFAHYWEDICFKNGPLVSPRVFREVCAPWYRKTSDLLAAHGVSLCSLDCDGCIDALVPIWLESGVNIMFPIEVGTWNASVLPWREAYGTGLRGVGGVNKNVFSRDRAAVDAEIARLRPIIEGGGFVPCVDHRIAPDAEFALVQYFCGRMHDIYH